MRTSSMDYYSLDTYLNMGQFQFLALDAEIAGLVDDLESVAEAQYWFEYWDERNREDGKPDSDLYEKRYYELLSDFKKKWFGASDEERMFRLKEHIDRRMENLRSELYDAIGVPPAARPEKEAKHGSKE